jgi:hypothetical protein
MKVAIPYQGNEVAADSTPNKSEWRVISGHHEGFAGRVQQAGSTASSSKKEQRL